MSALRSPSAAHELTRSPECLALERPLNDSISQIILHSVIQQEVCAGCKSYESVFSAFLPWSAENALPGSAQIHPHAPACAASSGSALLTGIACSPFSLPPTAAAPCNTMLLQPSFRPPLTSMLRLTGRAEGRNGRHSAARKACRGINTIVESEKSARRGQVVDLGCQRATIGRMHAVHSIWQRPVLLSSGIACCQRSSHIVGSVERHSKVSKSAFR